MFKAIKGYTLNIGTIVKRPFLLLVIMFLGAEVPAQLCQGSLGDPIVNITFGAGSNPGPVLTTTKNLNYFFNDCPQDGLYTVRNNTSRCHNNTWHTLNSDHTGDPNGYFMLVNASLQKSEFYIDTLKGLCPNTTYEFAAWITNVILPTACFGNPKTPNLTFNIEKTDGTVLQTYNTGDIQATQSLNWKQYGSFFTTPANGTNVVLRLINNSIGGCGNDLAIDDITFRPCGPQLTPSIKGVPDKVKTLCRGDNADITFECKASAGYNNPAYLWQQSSDGGNTWSDIAGENSNTMVRKFTSTTPAGQYLYRLTVGEADNVGLATCRVASSSLTIDVKNTPVIGITSNSPACEKSAISLSATGGTTASQYAWSGVNSFTATGQSVTINNVSSVNGGKYYVQVVNSDGCKHLDSTTVSVTPAPLISTGFTNKNICKGESVLLSSAGGTSYLWSPALGLSSTSIANPVAKPADSTVYTVVVSNAASCKDSARVTINVLKKPVANAGPDQVMVEGQAVQLKGSVTEGDADISWSPAFFIDNIHGLQPIVNPAISTSYILTATSNNGCGISIDTTWVQVYKNVVIPNAFSPNGDGVNDTWNIKALASYDNYELSVFNRYGQKVLDTKNYSTAWNGTFNGKPLPVGTYYYLLDLKLRLSKLKGYVVIMR
jgi:gliding motility-associated-like protein